MQILSRMHKKKGICLEEPVSLCFCWKSCYLSPGEGNGSWVRSGPSRSVTSAVTQLFWSGKCHCVLVLIETQEGSKYFVKCVWESRTASGKITGREEPKGEENCLLLLWGHGKTQAGRVWWVSQHRMPNEQGPSWASWLPVACQQSMCSPDTEEINCCFVLVAYSITENWCSDQAGINLRDK